MTEEIEPGDIHNPNLRLPTWDRRTFLGHLAAGGGLLIGGPTLAAFLDACATGGGNSTPTSRKGGHLVEAFTTGVQNLNPIFGAREIAGAWINNMMFPGLIAASADGVPTPVLATELPAFSADKLSVTFKLHQGVKFTDGTELTAEDVAFTYGTFYLDAYSKTNTARRASVSARIKSVEARDKYTVVFTLKDVWPPFLSTSAFYGIIPKHVLGGLTGEALNTAPFNTNPTVTSGPFKFQSYQNGQQVTLARNPQGFPGPALLDTYVFRQLSDSTAILNALESGEVDLGPLDPSLLSKAQTVQAIQVYSYVQNSIDLMFYQMDSAKPGSVFFSDPRVRQALLFALDRDKIAKSLYFGQAVVADSGIPVASWAHTSTNLKKYPFDRAQAEQLLDSAGWKKGSSGTRQKDGKEFKIEILSVSGQAPYGDVAANMQDAWSQIGVRATPRLIDFNALTDQWTNKRDFDVLLIQVQFPVDPDMTIIWSSNAAKPGGFNGSHWINSKIDDLCKQGAATYDINERKKIYAQFQEIYMTELPAAPLFYPKALYGVNKRVGGIVGALGTFNRFQRCIWMKDVYVKDGK